MAQEPLLDYAAILVESTPETTPPDVSPWIRYVAILTDGLAPTGVGPIIGSSIVGSSIVDSGIVRGAA